MRGCEPRQISLHCEPFTKCGEHASYTDRCQKKYYYPGNVLGLLILLMAHITVGAILKQKNRKL